MSPGALPAQFEEQSQSRPQSPPQQEQFTAKGFVKVAACPRQALALQEEARVLARCSCPHLPAVQHHDPAKGLLVLERFDGRLPDLVGDGLPEDKARSGIRQVAAALSYLHGLDYVHGCLSPASVLVRHGTLLCLTWAPAELGFQAPEMLCGAPASPQTDAFSLGALVYFVLTGGHPFENSACAEVVRERCLRGDIVVPIGRDGSMFSAACLRLLAGLTHVDTEKRWSVGYAPQGSWLRRREPTCAASTVRRGARRTLAEELVPR